MPLLSSGLWQGGCFLQRADAAAAFLAAVEDEIKWRPAKKAATQELDDHITDQCAALQAQGLSRQDALQQTLCALGDARQIGRQLNRLHRPKTNWALISSSAAMLLLGCLVDLRFVHPGEGGQGLCRLLLPVLIAIALLLLLNFLDYTLLIRFPKIFYTALLVLTLLVFCYDMRNGLKAAGYCYSFYLLLFFPIVQVGMASLLRRQHRNSALLELWLLLLPPLIIAALLASLAALLYLALADGILIAYTWVKRWFPRQRLLIIGGICLLILIGIGGCLIQLTQGSQQASAANPDRFLTQDIRQTLADMPFIRQALPAKANDTVAAPEYLLLRLADRYGSIVFVIAASGAAIISCLLLRTIQKQTSDWAFLMASLCSALFAIQFICALLGNLGLIGSAYTLPFPWIAGGGIYTIFNAFLIGMMLSVHRWANLAKDWTRLKQKEPRSHLR